MLCTRVGLQKSSKCRHFEIYTREIIKMNLFRNPEGNSFSTTIFSMYKPLFTGKQAQKLKKLKHY